jgi:spore cortex biosynthesis protein YabQ
MGLMLGSGVLLGVILDFYRVLTVRFRLRGWLISLIDLLYWVVSAGLVFGLLFWSNWGELRFYFFVAVCAGFLLYFKWFSRQVIRVIRLIILLVERFLVLMARILYGCVWVPLVGLWRLLNVVGKLLLWVVSVCLKGLLAPLVWLTRPFFRPLLRWMNPWFRLCGSWIEKGKRWWNKKKEKGG